jgi:hypothetical protein
MKKFRRVVRAFSIKDRTIWLQNILKDHIKIPDGLQLLIGKSASSCLSSMINPTG